MNLHIGGNVYTGEVPNKPLHCTFGSVRMSPCFARTLSVQYNTTAHLSIFFKILRLTTSTRS